MCVRVRVFASLTSMWALQRLTDREYAGAESGPWRGVLSLEIAREPDAGIRRVQSENR